MDLDFFKKLQENIPANLRPIFQEEFNKRRSALEIQNSIPSVEEYRAGSEARAAEIPEIPDDFWESIEDTNEVIVPEVITTSDQGAYSRGDFGGSDMSQADWENEAEWGEDTDIAGVTVPQTPTSADMVNGSGYMQGDFSRGVSPTQAEWEQIATGAPNLNDMLNGAQPKQPQMNIPQQLQSDILPETQELMNIQREYEDTLQNEEFALNFARSGRNLPTNPSEVDPDSLTPADMEAGRQILRGEAPTANLRQAEDAAKAVYYRDVMGGNLNG